MRRAGLEMCAATVISVLVLVGVVLGIPVEGPGGSFGMGFGVGMVLMVHAGVCQWISKRAGQRTERDIPKTSRRPHGSSRRATSVQSAEVQAGIDRLEQRNTGQWQGPDGAVMLVRWDPVIRRYFVNGEVCTDVDQLAELLERLELIDGWRPEKSSATVAIRARLDLPGWADDFR